MAKKGEGGAEPPVRFEQALADLEGVVRRLESGELPLEDALGAFERGVGLVKVLTERLADIETRVEVLMKTHGGALVTQPLVDDDPDDDA